jgi:hypothetical protein
MAEPLDVNEFGVTEMSNKELGATAVVAPLEEVLEPDDDVLCLCSPYR